MPAPHPPELTRRRAVELDANGEMRLGQAVDINYALLGPGLFHLLGTERGWSIAEWERWTLGVLRRELLA